MAKMEKVLKGDFKAILSVIEDGILRGSATASLEDSSDFSGGGIVLSLKAKNSASILFFAFVILYMNIFPYLYLGLILLFLQPFLELKLHCCSFLIIIINLCNNKIIKFGLENEF